jgi:transketolase
MPIFGITSKRVVDAARTLARRAAHRREQVLPDQIIPSNTQTPTQDESI